MRSLFNNPKAMAPINLQRLQSNFHSVAKQASFLFFEFLRFSMGLGKFWEPKMEAKIDFGNVFCHLFFERDFGINFGSNFDKIWINFGSNLD